MNPVPSIPHMTIELSGRLREGRFSLFSVGTVTADVSNVKTPVVDTLKWVNEVPLKSNGKGRVSIGDQSGPD